MKKAFVFLVQIGLIWVIYTVSDYIVGFLHLPIPASVFGMILLYFLLAKGIIKVRYIAMAASFFNKHLAFFFIPFAVGLMNYGGLLKSSGVQILIMIAVSSILGLVITAGLTQFLSRKEEAKSGQPDSH